MGTSLFQNHLSAHLFFLPAFGGTFEQILTIENAKKDQLPGLWKQYETKENFRYLVMKRWIEVAPEEFLKTSLHRSELERGWMLRGQFEGAPGRPRIANKQVFGKIFDDSMTLAFIQGLASERPQKTMDFIRSNESLQRPDVYLAAFVGAAIGFTNSNPSRAIPIIDKRSKATWKLGYYELTNGREIFRVSSPWDEACSYALSRWVVFSPEEAFSLLTSEEDLALHPWLVSNLYFQMPGQLGQLYRTLPSGRKKRELKDAIDSAKEDPTEFKRLLTLPPSSKIGNEFRFDSLLRATSTDKLATFPFLLADYRLAHRPRKFFSVKVVDDFC